ncbi:MAG: hypothetical protein Q8O89_04610 [Nanoarchaeota archaeon]|nr:hypothetical protein [Nanoarchaeota archaeon]
MDIKFIKKIDSNEVGISPERYTDAHLVQIRKSLYVPLQHPRQINVIDLKKEKPEFSIASGIFSDTSILHDNSYPGRESPFADFRPQNRGAGKIECMYRFGDNIFVTVNNPGLASHLDNILVLDAKGKLCDIFPGNIDSAILHHPETGETPLVSRGSMEDLCITGSVMSHEDGPFWTKAPLLWGLGSASKKWNDLHYYLTLGVFSIGEGSIAQMGGSFRPMSKFDSSYVILGFSSITPNDVSFFLGKFGAEGKLQACSVFYDFRNLNMGINKELEPEEIKGLNDITGKVSYSFVDWRGPDERHKGNNFIYVPVKNGLAVLERGDIFKNDANKVSEIFGDEHLKCPKYASEVDGNLVVANRQITPGGCSNSSTLEFLVYKINK